jgi:hypothetical protein
MNCVRHHSVASNNTFSAPLHNVQVPCLDPDWTLVVPAPAPRYLGPGLGSCLLSTRPPGPQAGNFRTNQLRHDVCHLQIVGYLLHNPLLHCHDVYGVLRSSIYLSHVLGFSVVAEAVA